MWIVPFPNGSKSVPRTVPLQGLNLRPGVGAHLETARVTQTSPDSEVELDDAVQPGSLAGSVEHADHAPYLRE